MCKEHENVELPPQPKPNALALQVNLGISILIMVACLVVDMVIGIMELSKGRKQLPVFDQVLAIFGVVGGSAFSLLLCLACMSYIATGVVKWQEVTG